MFIHPRGLKNIDCNAARHITISFNQSRDSELFYTQMFNTVNGSSIILILKV